MDQQPRISLCIIARDEEANLPRCLRSAADLVDEIILVDTGSTDATVDIAERHGARVFHHPWGEDFAAARNAALERATGDWILVLDADDELSPEGRHRLRDLVAQAPVAVTGFAFTIASWIGSSAGGHLSKVLHPRLWRNRAEFRYRGRIHEWIDVGPLVYTGITIFHHGYLTDPATVIRKSSRNLALLNTALEASPESPYYRAQLGAECLRLGRLPEAVAQYRFTWSQERSHFVADSLAHALLRLRRYREAQDLLETALAIWPDYTDLYYRLGAACMGLGDYTRARATLKRCLQMGPPPPQYQTLEGYSSFMAWLQLGHAEAALHNWQEAAAACWQALTARADYTPAISLLIRSLVALTGPEGALRVVEEQISPTPSALQRLAAEFAAWGCWPQALVLLDRAERAGLADPALRADCLLALGEPELAEGCLPRAGQGRREQGIRRLVTWLKEPPDHWPCRTEREAINLIEKLLVTGHPELAFACGRQSLSERAGPEISGAVGRLYRRYGHPAEAIPLLQDALARWGARRRPLPGTGGGRVELLIDLGDALLRTGNQAGAASAFQRALAREPFRIGASLGRVEAALRVAAELLGPGSRQVRLWDFAEEVCRERHRGEPLYDRPGRRAEPEQGAGKREGVGG